MTDPRDEYFSVHRRSEEICAAYWDERKKIAMAISTFGTCTQGDLWNSESFLKPPLSNMTLVQEMQDHHKSQADKNRNLSCFIFVL